MVIFHSYVSLPEGILFLPVFYGGVHKKPSWNNPSCSITSAFLFSACATCNSSGSLLPAVSLKILQGSCVNMCQYVSTLDSGCLPLSPTPTGPTTWGGHCDPYPGIVWKPPHTQTTQKVFDPWFAWIDGTDSMRHQWMEPHVGSQPTSVWRWSKSSNCRSLTSLETHGQRARFSCWLDTTTIKQLMDNCWRNCSRNQRPLEHARTTREYPKIHPFQVLNWTLLCVRSGILQ